MGLLDRFRTPGVHDERPTIDDPGSIRRALWLEQFSVHYQPVVDIDTGSLVGMEAFVRWDHPNVGLISAREFLPAAQRAGLMLPLDIDTLRAATAFRRHLAVGTEEMRVTLNLSAGELLHPSLIDTISQILDETGLPPKLVEIEISEDSLTGSQRGPDAVRELHELGVTVALDDLAPDAEHGDLIRELPIDRAKIDFSQLPPALSGHEAEDVEKIRLYNEHREAAHAAIDAAVSLAREWGMDITAKRVESIEHLSLLRKYGISRAQGYVLGRPVSESEFGTLASDLRKIA